MCARVVFSSLVFGGLSLGRNFKKFQKMRDEGDLAKFAIARLCGTLGFAVCSKMLCYVCTLSAL